MKLKTKIKIKSLPIIKSWQLKTEENNRKVKEKDLRYQIKYALKIMKQSKNQKTFIVHNITFIDLLIISPLPHGTGETDSLTNDSWNPKSVTAFNYCIKKRSFKWLFDYLSHCNETFTQSDHSIVVTPKIKGHLILYKPLYMLFKNIYFEPCEYDSVKNIVETVLA